MPQPGDCDDTNPDINEDVEVDLFDGEFVDANCDGVDGILADMVFVHSEADPTIADGTQAFPFTTISQGLAHAEMDGYQVVAVSTGEYVEEVDLIEGIALRWVASMPTLVVLTAENESLIRNGVVRDGRISGVTASNIAEQTQIIRMTIESEDAAENNLSSYGLYGRNVPGLVVRNSIMRAGRGGAGDDGANGEAGENGENGGQGGNCGGGAGEGGASVCGTPGFRGGAGSGRATRGNDGEPGGCGGRGGDRGNIGSGDDGEEGCDGAAGITGEAGDEGFSATTRNGQWTQGRAGTGGSEGAVSVAAAAEAAAVVQ